MRMRKRGLRNGFAVNPDALKQSETRNRDKKEGAPIANHWKWQPGDRRDGHSHADIHENMGKKQHDNSYGEQATKLIPSLRGNIEAKEQENGKGWYQEQGT
jgi:hypothetical protein